MTTNEKRDLIHSFSEDYFKRTGEHIKLIPCSRWEASASLQENVSFWKIAKLVFDFTGWSKEDTYNRSQKEEKVFRRALIDFIAVSNGCSYVSCGKLTNRDHTTILYSVNRFENRLETEPHTKRYFNEVISYIKENLYIYRDKNITDEDII